MVSLYSLLFHCSPAIPCFMMFKPEDSPMSVFPALRAFGHEMAPGDCPGWPSLCPQTAALRGGQGAGLYTAAGDIGRAIGPVLSPAWLRKRLGEWLPDTKHSPPISYPGTPLAETLKSLTPRRGQPLLVSFFQFRQQHVGSVYACSRSNSVKM